MFAISGRGHESHKKWAHWCIVQEVLSRQLTHYQLRCFNLQVTLYRYLWQITFLIMRGIENIANNCFANSRVQALARCSEFAAHGHNENKK